jgi:hypothetical protein
LGAVVVVLLDLEPLELQAASTSANTAAPMINRVLIIAPP